MIAPLKRQPHVQFQRVQRDDWQTKEHGSAQAASAGALRPTLRVLVEIDQHVVGDVAAHRDAADTRPSLAVAQPSQERAPSSLGASQAPVPGPPFQPPACPRSPAHDGSRHWPPMIAIKIDLERRNVSPAAVARHHAGLFRRGAVRLGFPGGFAVGLGGGGAGGDAARPRVQG